jgi:hypothetical protein
MSTSPLRRISKSWKVRYRHYLVDESGRPRYSSITRNNFRNPGCRKRHITRYSPYNFNATGSCRTSGPITRLYQTFHDLLMRPPTLRLPNSESVSLCRILPSSLRYLPISSCSSPFYRFSRPRGSHQPNSCLSYAWKSTNGRVASPPL